MKKLYIVAGFVVVAILAVVSLSHIPSLSNGSGGSLSATTTNAKSAFCTLPLFSKFCNTGDGKTLTIAQMTLSANGATNASDASFLTNSDQAAYSDTMKLAAGTSSVTLGFSAVAGGYVSYMGIKGFGKPALEGKNLDNLGYGKGWQSTLRDLLHNLQYNPAVVGFTGYLTDHQHGTGVGAPVKIDTIKDRAIVIRQANVPLYTDGNLKYDFTQNETSIPDIFAKDGGNTDSDNLPEANIGKYDEIRSEFDYTGAYLNMTTQFGIPATRHDFAYAYIRDPKSILQFSDPRDVNVDGQPIYIPNRRMLDISLSTPGNQTASSTDLSSMLPTYGVRVYPKDFKSVMWTEGGVWKVVPSSPNNKDRVKVANCQLGSNVPGYKYVSPINAYITAEVTCRPDNDLLIVSSDSDPNTAFAIGLYYPQSFGLNARQTWVVDKNTMQVVSREDRRLQTFMYSTGGVTVTRPLIAGLRSPLSLVAAGLTHHFEIFTERVYVLFGTPAQIKAAVEKFKQSKYYAIEAGT